MPPGESRGDMRRVLIVTDRTPFTDAKRDALCDQLVLALQSSAAAAEAIRLPYQADARTSLPGMLARRSFDVWNADRLIALSFPACLIAHPEKIVWLVDDARGAPGMAPAVELALDEAKRVYSVSRRASTGLFRVTGCKSKVLPIPSLDSEWRRIAVELLS